MRLVALFHMLMCQSLVQFMYISSNQLKAVLICSANCTRITCLIVIFGELLTYSIELLGFQCSTFYADLLNCLSVLTTSLAGPFNEDFFIYLYLDVIKLTTH